MPLFFSSGSEAMFSFNQLAIFACAFQVASVLVALYILWRVSRTLQVISGASGHSASKLDSMELRMDFNQTSKKDLLRHLSDEVSSYEEAGPISWLQHKVGCRFEAFLQVRSAMAQNASISLQWRLICTSAMLQALTTAIVWITDQEASAESVENLIRVFRTVQRPELKFWTPFKLSELSESWDQITAFPEYDLWCQIYFEERTQRQQQQQQ